MLFDDKFERDADPVKQSQDVATLSSVEHGARGMTAFLSDHAGASYAHGLYRIHPIANMPRWTELVVEAFPNFRGLVFCFGFDWLGRMFALDYERKTDGQFLVLMFDPGAGQVLEIPATFMDFHNEELMHYQDEALAAELYIEWQKSGGESPTFEQCIGYKIPLFLNGSDSTENLEPIDMEVYWSISAQLLSKVQSLPEGTPHEDEIHLEIVRRIVEATPEWWEQATLKLEMRSRDGTDVCEHSIANTQHPNDIVEATDELMQATRQLELLYKQKGTPLSSAVFDIWQNSEQQWEFKVNFSYS